MAIDLKRILIRDVNIACLLHNSSSWRSKKFYKWSTTNYDTFPLKYKKRQNKYYYGTKYIDSGCVHVEYMRYSEFMGDLLLTVSFPELYFGNNSHFLYTIDSDDFAERMLNELRFVLDVAILPPWKEWGISRDEITFDIPDSIANNKLRFDTIAKHKKLPYKKMDCSFKEKGSIYFHSGKNRKKAGVQLIIYNKDLQQAAKGNSLHQLLQLPPSHDILRIEEKTKGAALRHRIDKTRTRNQIAKEFTNLQIALSPEHQTLHIRNIISTLGLDMKITTRENLNHIIDNLRCLRHDTRKNCKRVIRYLNGEFKTINLNEKTITKYKNVILQTGFHFLYAERDIPPVKIDEETGICVVMQ